jgi:hypothetical protein
MPLLQFCVLIEHSTLNPENLKGEAKIPESDSQVASENFSVLLSGNNQQFG